MHRRFIAALDGAVTRHSSVEQKPLELDLAAPAAGLGASLPIQRHAAPGRAADGGA